MSADKFIQSVSGERWWDEVISSVGSSVFDLHNTYQHDKDGREAVKANLPALKVALRQLEAVVRKAKLLTPETSERLSVSHQASAQREHA